MIRGRRALCAALPPSHQTGPTNRTAATSHGATTPAAPLMPYQCAQRCSQASLTATCRGCAVKETAAPLSALRVLVAAWRLHVSLGGVGLPGGLGCRRPGVMGEWARQL